MTTLSPYKQRAYDQGKEWVAGISKHNDIDDECCPDFSCCVPEIFEKDRLVRRANFNNWCRQYGYTELPADA